MMCPNARRSARGKSEALWGKMADWTWQAIKGGGLRQPRARWVDRAEWGWLQACERAPSRANGAQQTWFFRRGDFKSAWRENRALEKGLERESVQNFWKTKIRSNVFVVIEISEDFKGRHLLQKMHRLPFQIFARERDISIACEVSEKEFLRRWRERLLSSSVNHAVKSTRMRLFGK